MTEDFTSLAVAYLLEELDPAARAEFEARLAADPAATRELKEIAGQFRILAEAEAPPLPLPEAVRQEMLERILHPRSGRALIIVGSFRRIAWPLAAAILLTLNLAQWIHNRRAHEANPGAIPIAAFKPTRVPAPPVTGGLTGAASTSSLHREPLPAVPTARPSIRQIVTFSIVQTTVTSSSVTRVVREENTPPQQGALELHNLPRIADNRCLYLWARRAGSESFEPVGEIPRQVYGGSGTINYQLRPGAGAATRFVVTVELGHHVPAAPSLEVICAGP